MKLNEPKVEIISRGADPSVDFIFSDNFCPCCSTNCQKVSIQKFSKEGLLFTYHGRQATIKCPSCGTVFQKEICDNKELTSVSDTIFFFSVMVLILSILGLLIFSILNIPTGIATSLVIALISFGICGTAASD